MIMRYYVFDQPEVLSAAKAYSDQVSQLSDECHVMAAAFGGSALYAGGIHGRRFAGLVFDPPLVSPLWTKPDKQFGKVQRPRRTCKAADRAELADITKRWDQLEPKTKPSTDDLFKACDTDWGNLLFNGVGYVITDSAVYLCTSLNLTKKGREITGGEYQKAASEQAPKKVKA